MKVNNIPNNNTQGAGKNVAFKSSLTDLGKNARKHILETYVEPTRQGTISRNLFVLTAFSFLLSGRLINSRDNNERRETLTRDIPTIALAVHGVPIFERITAKILQKKSGFAIIKDAKGNTASADQIKDWYVLDNALASGFDGFMGRLNTLNGNLKKITSSLSENIKGQLADFSKNNTEFINELSKEEHKGLKQSIIEAFQNKKNAAFEIANFKKSLPKYAGIATTIALVGVLIPQSSIALTEAINKKKKTTELKPNETAKTEKSLPIMQHSAKLKTAQNSSSNSTKLAFAQFLGDK